MRIAISASMDFAHKAKEVSELLEKAGHEVHLPEHVEQIVSKKLKLEDYRKQKNDNIASNILSRVSRVVDHDAVLVLNYERHGIENHVGGNVFLEMAMAHAQGKKIYLLNDIPELYKEDIKELSPTVLKGDINQI